MERILAPTTYKESLYGLPLTDRELEVLAAVVKHGMQLPAAKALRLSHQTLKNHLSNIYGKVGAESIIDALRIVGWLDASGGHQHRAEIRITEATRLLREATAELEKVTKT